jgi:hypothetical protein
VGLATFGPTTFNVTGDVVLVWRHANRLSDVTRDSQVRLETRSR